MTAFIIALALVAWMAAGLLVTRIFRFGQKDDQ